MLVEAITTIKSTYGELMKRNWDGDPCAPIKYLWEGLNSSYDGSNNPPRITSLNLSSSELTGDITSYISKLNWLQSLDLSNNSLTGPVPKFLSQMPNLKVLNLKGNCFTEIPAELFAKSKNHSLSLSIDTNNGEENNNKFSSSPSKRETKSNILIAIASSVGGLVLLLLVAAGIRIAIYIRQQVPTEGVTTGTGEPEIQNGLFEEKKRQFTYSEVLTITNNFERVLGSGGFGTVYHGCIGDMQVAVKKLSPSSVQGYQQFQAEVKLLMMVHHRNLTSLIGYCNEGSNMPLIYDYMSNGDLDSQLLDEGNAVLNWERRLKIAQDAAQGLDYLHNGCKPPIVHRDVKTTNILLNENFQAKLADFGLSRSFPTHVGSHVSTVVAGTPGYLDPELRGDFETNSVWKAVEIAMACVSPKSTKRPNMSQVVTELKDCLAVELAPRNQGHATNTTNSIEALPAQITSELGPLAR